MPEPPKRIPKPTGRPPKLTPEVHDKIVQAIRAGAYIETAAAFAGIHKSTFYDWLQKGARQKTGKHRRFSDAIERATAEAQISDLAIIDRAARGYKVERTKRVEVREGGPGGKLLELREETTTAFERYWQAAAWKLERRNPELWGRTRTELTGADGEPLEPVVVYLPDNGRPPAPKGEETEGAEVQGGGEDHGVSSTDAPRFG